MADISTQELAAKFNAKIEFHWFLVHDMDAFLPAAKHVTVYHLRDLMSGEKKVSKSSRSCFPPDSL